MLVRLVLMIAMLATLVLGGLVVDSSSPYYWLREGSYFVYHVRSDFKATCTIEDSSGYIFRFPFDNLRVKWSVLRVEGEWMWVNLSLIAVRARNINTSESLDYTASKVFKVNLRTLQAYTEWDIYKEFWVKEWPFLLRPEQSLGGTVKLFKLRIIGPMVGIQSDRPWHDEKVKPVLDKINETIVRLTNGSRSLKDYMRVIYDDERTKFFYINVIPKGWSKWTEGKQLGLVLEIITLDPPPAGRDYSYSNITLDRVRIVKGAGSIFVGDLEKFEKVYSAFLKLYTGLDEIAEVYNMTTLLRSPEGDKYLRHIIAVDRRGDVYYVESWVGPRVDEILYDSISGVLLYARLRDRGFLTEIVGWFELGLMDAECNERFAEVSVELLLADTNIEFERPVIGATITTPQATVEKPLDTITPVEPLKTGQTLPATPPARAPSRLPIALIAVTLLLLVALVAALRYRGR